MFITGTIYHDRVANYFIFFNFLVIFFTHSFTLNRALTSRPIIYAFFLHNVKSTFGHGLVVFEWNLVLFPEKHDHPLRHAQGTSLASFDIIWLRASSLIRFVFHGIKHKYINRATKYEEDKKFAQNVTQLWKLLCCTLYKQEELNWSRVFWINKTWWSICQEPCFRPTL